MADNTAVQQDYNPTVNAGADKPAWRTDSGGRGRGRGQNRGKGKGFGSQRNREAREEGDRNPKGEMGRGDFYRRGGIDKRKRNEEEQAAKRIKADASGDTQHLNPFSKEEIEAEVRRPKRKVAVMIGYAGTGYKGMQINDREKTIEGDLFKAFVAAGAISKVNADDPKKSHLVRCARTDKGVHAAGNVISLKLIVEDADIVKKINDNLPPQIRVWGFERTNAAFSCYQTCDSRWYEYLIPTFAFLPPHPSSFLGIRIRESAEEKGILVMYEALQEDVAMFWETAEEAYIKPLLEKLNPELRSQVMNIIHKDVVDSNGEDAVNQQDSSHLEVDDVPLANVILKRKADEFLVPAEPAAKRHNVDGSDDETTKDSAMVDRNEMMEGEKEAAAAISSEDRGPLAKVAKSEHITNQESTGISNHEDRQITSETGSTINGKHEPRVLSPLETAVKDIKAAYIAAKKAYRISDFRRQRLQDALQSYVGTHNFHNYTIQKNFTDPSAKRVIRSFHVNPKPVYINDTEWLSLKVHGQSFMMHQIRKMIGMAALVVRCGTHLNLIKESFGSARMSIPKAPGLGLLLERPIFDNYNLRAVNEFQREKIDFDKYQKEMDEFKQREIYDRIFREEEKEHQFHSFFHHIDHFHSNFFLWVTAAGIAASEVGPAKGELKRLRDASDDEDIADTHGQEG